MIEIKCSKAQFNRIMTNLTDAGCLVDGKCVLGKGYNTCPSLNKNKTISCKDCLNNHIKHVNTDKETNEIQEAVMSFAVSVLAGVAECAKQEDAPIYKGDVEDDYFVRLSDVNDVINKHLN